MTSSAVFLDANSVDGLTSSVSHVGTDALIGTICWADPVNSDSADTPVSPAVEAAARRLIQIVTELRSPGGGWPSDLPQTPEHLGPYITEEVEELKAVLQQSAAGEGGAKAVPSLWPLLEQVPRWLWEMAATSYEAMRLLEGVKTRIHLENGKFRWSVVRLAPVICLTTTTHQWTLDLVTQTQADGVVLAEDARFQLIDSDLDQRSMTVSELKGVLHQRFEQQSAILNRLLNQGQGVTALVPDQPWETGRLQLTLTLVETADAPLDVLDALPEGGSVGQPISPALDDFVTQPSWEPIVEPPVSATVDPLSSGDPASSADDGTQPGRFTLEDFAELLPTHNGIQTGRFTLEDFADWLPDPAQPLAAEAAPVPEAAAHLAQGSLAQSLECSQSFSPDKPVEPPAVKAAGERDQPMPDEASVLSAWITLTDEAWIQAFLEATAVRTLCRQLAAQAAALDLTEAAFESVSQTLGSSGLFKQTFVHQPMLVADLWPRLRWYLTRCSVPVMQLMGGRSASVLVPGAGWQYGTLYLKALLWLEIEGQTWGLDCANGEEVGAAPEPLPAAAVMMLSGEVPTKADQLSGALAHDLARQMPFLAGLIQGIAVDVHALDWIQPQRGRLKLDWRLTLVGASTDAVPAIVSCIGTPPCHRHDF